MFPPPSPGVRDRRRGGSSPPGLGAYAITRMASTVLLTGATGYVGGTLLPELLRRGRDVRCLVRRPERTELPPEADVARGDVLDDRSLPAALDGVEVAFYLVHSMGR